MKDKIPLTFILSCLVILVGCAKKWNDNQEYMNYLASLIIECRTSQGSLPKNVDEVVSRLNVTLPNRGDLDGNPLFYGKIDNEAFMMRSYGVNRENDFGGGDDLDIYYIEGKPVNRLTFISFLKSYNNGLFWAIFGDQFR
jgi:hypothetical protein